MKYYYFLSRFCPRTYERMPSITDNECAQLTLAAESQNCANPAVLIGEFAAILGLKIEDPSASGGPSNEMHHASGGPSNEMHHASGGPSNEMHHASGGPRHRRHRGRNPNRGFAPNTPHSQASRRLPHQAGNDDVGNLLNVLLEWIDEPSAAPHGHRANRHQGNGANRHQGNGANRHQGNRHQGNGSRSLP